jgi:hypothetical protein
MNSFLPPEIFESTRYVIGKSIGLRTRFIQMAVFWIVAPCRLVRVYQR